MSRLVLALSVILVLASAPAASSRPHVPATNGWIVFSSDRMPIPFTSYGLYRLDPVGASVTRLGMLAGQSPAWSPDGSLIAFSDRRHRLVVARSDGTQPGVIVNRPPIVADAPAWSPDGSRIVFQGRHLRGGFGRDLWLVRADGTGLRRLQRARYDDLQPSWSPDGSLIAFSSNRRTGMPLESHEIYVVRSDGSGLRALTSNRVQDFSPEWSPDGSLLALSRSAPGQGEAELWTMRRDGTGERRVQRASSAAGAVWSDHGPSWSPDGNWLVYASNEGSSLSDVFIVRPNGEDKTNLTPGSYSSDADPAWQPVCSHAGTPRRDVLRGTPADDRVCGFAGADVLAGGAGRDGLYGGDGADRLSSRDRSFDVVGCGPGRDEVVADRVDLVGADCERVRRG